MRGILALITEMLITRIDVHLELGWTKHLLTPGFRLLTPSTTPPPNFPLLPRLVRATLPLCRGAFG